MRSVCGARVTLALLAGRWVARNGGDSFAQRIGRRIAAVREDQQVPLPVDRPLLVRGMAAAHESRQTNERRLQKPSALHVASQTARAGRQAFTSRPARILGPHDLPRGNRRVT